MLLTKLKNTAEDMEDGSRLKYIDILIFTLIHLQISYFALFCTAILRLICKGELEPLPSPGKFAQRIRFAGYFPPH